jgi:1,4-dihydroxy-2-naphthoate octaprenyltransferase
MVLDELKQIEIAQKKFKKTTGLIVGILIVAVSIILAFIGISQSKGEFILFGLIAFVIGVLLIVLNKIGLNMIKKQRY